MLNVFYYTRNTNEMIKTLTCCVRCFPAAVLIESTAMKPNQLNPGRPTAGSSNAENVVSSVINVDAPVIVETSGKC